MKTIKRFIKEEIDLVDEILINGKCTNYETYQYQIGKRLAYCSILEFIDNLLKQLNKEI